MTDRSTIDRIRTAKGKERKAKAEALDKALAYYAKGIPADDIMAGLANEFTKGQGDE